VVSPLPVTLVMNDNDHIAPLANGDVTVPGVALTLDRQRSFITARDDPSVDACEMSFSHYVRGIAAGARDWVGLPVFPMRAFRHRCFFVQSGSELRDLADLDGQRIGTNGYSDSGNTWARAALRDREVDLSRPRWFVGPVDHPASAVDAASPARSPEGVSEIEPDQSLRQLLLDGGLDAIMCPWPPAGFDPRHGPVRRLLPNYRAVEIDYARRVGFVPGHHLIAVRRELVDSHPWLAPRLVTAFEQAKQRWQAARRYHADTSPWLLADLELTSEVIGEDWQPTGVSANQPMIAAFCAELHAQRLTPKAIDPSSIFAVYEQISGAA